MEDEPIEIPLERLRPEVLESIVDEFVLQEGTDYGHADIPIETKRRQVMAQLREGGARVVFDPDTETCTIVVRQR